MTADFPYPLFIPRMISLKTNINNLLKRLLKHITIKLARPYFWANTTWCERKDERDSI